MGELIQMERPERAYQGRLCECGSAWFDASVVIDQDGAVTGYRLPIKCHDCGKQA